jgi:hypothetical protein
LCKRPKAIFTEEKEEQVMKKVCLGCVFAVLVLVAALTIVAPARAGSGNAISMSLSGPITVNSGASFGLAVNPTNNLQPITNSNLSTTQNTLIWAKVQTIIINPWTGQVISGPIQTNVNQAVQSWYFDSSSGTRIPGNNLTSFSTTSMVLPKTQKAAQSLVALVYAMDDHSKVIGTAYWGFAVTAAPKGK